MKNLTAKEKIQYFLLFESFLRSYNISLREEQRNYLNCLMWKNEFNTSTMLHKNRCCGKTHFCMFLIAFNEKCPVFEIAYICESLKENLEVQNLIKDKFQIKIFHYCSFFIDDDIITFPNLSAKSTLVIQDHSSYLKIRCSKWNLNLNKHDLKKTLLLYRTILRKKWKIRAANYNLEKERFSVPSGKCAFCHDVNMDCDICKIDNSLCKEKGRKGYYYYLAYTLALYDGSNLLLTREDLLKTIKLIAFAYKSTYLKLLNLRVSIDFDILKKPIEFKMDDLTAAGNIYDSAKAYAKTLHVMIDGWGNIQEVHQKKMKETNNDLISHYTQTISLYERSLNEKWNNSLHPNQIQTICPFCRAYTFNCNNCTVSPSICAKAGDDGYIKRMLISKDKSKKHSLKYRQNIFPAQIKAMRFLMKQEIKKLNAKKERLELENASYPFPSISRLVNRGLINLSTYYHCNQCNKVWNSHGYIGMSVKYMSEGGKVIFLCPKCVEKNVKELKKGKEKKGVSDNGMV